MISNLTPLLIFTNVLKCMEQIYFLAYPPYSEPPLIIFPWCRTVPVKPATALRPPAPLTPVTTQLPATTIVVVDAQTKPNSRVPKNLGGGGGFFSKRGPLQPPRAPDTGFFDAFARHTLGPHHRPQILATGGGEQRPVKFIEIFGEADAIRNP